MLRSISTQYDLNGFRFVMAIEMVLYITYWLPEQDPSVANAYPSMHAIHVPASQSSQLVSMHATK